MRHVSATTTVLLLTLACSVSLHATQTETVGQFVLSMPARTVDPIIEYCSERIPEIKDDLLKERAGFVQKLTAAGQPLMEKLKNDPEFNAPVQASMRQEVDKANAYALSVLEQRDPDITCRATLENMQHATVEALRKPVEATYQKFRGAGQGKGSK